MSRKILIFSPLPPLASGVASYTDVLAQELSRLNYQVTIIVNQHYVSTTPRYEVRHWTDFLYCQLPKDAVILYQVGNNIFHEYMFPFLFSEPGIVTLHDFILGHGRLESLIHALTPVERRNELIYDLGLKAGDHLAGIIDHGVTGHQLPFAARLNRAVLESSILTIVHNPDTCRIIRMQNPAIGVECFPMGIWEREAWDPIHPDQVALTRKKLGVNSTTMVLGTFGVVNPYKQLDVLLQVHKELYQQGCRILFLIVGYLTPAANISGIISNLGLQSCVKVISNAKKEEYWDLIRATDICYSLRFPPAGEFSLSVLEQMACRRVVVVNQHRFNTFLADDICIKVRNANQKEDLLVKTRALYQNPELRIGIGFRAMEYARSHFSMQGMIDGYIKVIEAYDDYRKEWKDRRMDFPSHLQPINRRVLQETLNRFAQPVPEPVLSDIHRALT